MLQAVLTVLVVGYLTLKLLNVLTVAARAAGRADGAGGHRGRCRRLLHPGLPDAPGLHQVRLPLARRAGVRCSRFGYFVDGHAFMTMVCAKLQVDF